MLASRPACPCCHDKLDAVEVAADHGVDRVAAAATDADDEDLCVLASSNSMSDMAVIPPGLI